MEKYKLAFYWASSCGGCEVAVLDIHENILKVIDIADIVFWPVAIDTKYKDVEAMKDNYIDVCFFNGAIRLSEQEHLAHLLRQKSKIMVAFGSCACYGSIPGLANFFYRDEIMNRAYLETPSTVNPKNILPQEVTKVKEGEITIPEFYDTVHTLGQTVEVDYFVPGCPPVPDQVMTLVEALDKKELPPKGSVIAGDKTLCDTCERLREEKIVPEFKRIVEVIPNNEKCFLEEGIICCGPATRSGCGNRCINANQPCRGCFGPAPEIHDQGAKLLSAIASISAINEEERVEEFVNSIPDPAGYFYRFTLPYSMLKRKLIREEKK